MSMEPPVIQGRLFGDSSPVPEVHRSNPDRAQ
jgi:hypothetical protein